MGIDSQTIHSNPIKCKYKIGFIREKSFNLRQNLIQSNKGFKLIHPLWRFLGIKTLNYRFDKNKSILDEIAIGVSLIILIWIEIVQNCSELFEKSTFSPIKCKIHIFSGCKKIPQLLYVFVLEVPKIICAHCACSWHTHILSGFKSKPDIQLVVNVMIDTYTYTWLVNIYCKHPKYKNERINKNEVLLWIYFNPFSAENSTWSWNQ